MLKCKCNKDACKGTIPKYEQIIELVREKEVTKIQNKIKNEKERKNKGYEMRYNRQQKETTTQISITPLSPIDLTFHDLN